MKRKKKSNKFKMFIKNNLFLLLIIVATLFMSVGYATVNSVSLDLTGTSNIKSRPAVIITDATITSGTNGTDTLRSSIDMLHEDIMKSRIVLGSNQSATLTVSMTILNNTSDKRMFTGVTYGNNFYDNNNISYSLSGLNVGDTLAPGASKTYTITFSYNSSNTSNNVLNSYLKFNFEKYWTITYSHIDTTNKNYPDYILESETTKTVTFNGDIPYDVQISPSVTYTYTSPTLTLTNVTQDITINRYYSITYNLNGGTNGSNPPDRYLHGQTVTLPTPTNGNQVFGGWFKNSSFSGSAISDTSNQSENLNLYAKWQSNSGPQIIENDDGSIITITTEVVNGVQLVTGYNIDTSGTANGYIDLPSGGIETGVLVFDEYDFEATLTATFTFNDITTNFPVLNMSANNNNDMHGIALTITRATSGMGTAYNESGNTIGNVNSNNPAVKFRYIKYENGAAVGNASQDFYSNKGTTAYSSNRFGTKTATFTLMFKIIKQNGVFSVEIDNSSGSVVAKPKGSATISFSSITNDVEFIIGHWTSTSNQEVDCPMKVVSFNIVKTID